MASPDSLCLQPWPAGLALSTLVQKPLSRDARLPGTPEAEQLGSMIYELRKERLPGAELSNFWRNTDKEIGIGLRTRVGKISAREPLALTVHSYVTSLLLQLKSAQNQHLRTTTEGSDRLGSLLPPTLKTQEKAQLCFWGTGAHSSSLICPSRHPALLCKVPASQADGKGWLQRAPGAQSHKAEPNQNKQAEVWRVS